LRLLFAIKSLNVDGGGAERVLVDVANGLSARGHEAAVLTFDSPGASFYALNEKVKRLDLGLGTPGRPTPRLGFLKGMGRVRHAVREANAEFMIAFMHSTYVPVAVATLGCSPPLIFSEHIDAEHYRTRPLQRAIVRLASRLAVAKTVPSEPLRAEHSDGERRRVHVMPNAVDLHVFGRVAGHPPSQPPILLSVGRFMAQKNHEELIAAFARVAPRFPDWGLRIVGDGELRPQLEAASARTGLGDRIELPGATRDVAAEYARASIVALPSLYESFGLVAAEALASGRALVAFDRCLGIAELVRDGENGLLVASSGDRVAHLAAGLERLMGDAELRRRLAAAGPSSVQRYSIGRVLDEWESLLERLRQRRGTSGS